MASKKLTKKKSSRPKSKLSLVNFKATRKDRARLKENAKLHQNGNLSAWMLRAGLNYKPIDG